MLKRKVKENGSYKELQRTVEKTGLQIWHKQIKHLIQVHNLSYDTKNLYDILNPFIPKIFTKL